MNRYEELGAKWWATRERWFEYQNECVSVIKQIEKALRAHLGIPDKYVASESLDADSPSISPYSFDHERHWQVGLRLTFRLDERTEPTLPMVVPIGVRRMDDLYVVSIGLDGKVVTVPVTDPLDLKAVVATIDRGLEDSLTSSVLGEDDPGEEPRPRRLRLVEDDDD